MNQKRENRFNETTEIRVDTSAENTRKIGGYAAVFNSETKIGQRFVEKIAYGAFGESIAKEDIRALWSHNTDLVIGRNKNGTLSLTEDARGLGFELNMPDTSWGRDAFTLIRDGYVSGVSFGFETLKDSWQRGEDGAPHIRTLEKVRLIEISPTAFPAYEETQVAARSAEQIIKDIEESWKIEENRTKQPTIDELRKQLEKKELYYRTVLI